METAPTIYVAKDYIPSKILGFELPRTLFPKIEYLLFHEDPDERVNDTQKRALEGNRFDSIMDLAKIVAETACQEEILPELNTTVLPELGDGITLRILSDSERGQLQYCIDHL